MSKIRRIYIYFSILILLFLVVGFSFKVKGAEQQTRAKPQYYVTSAYTTASLEIVIYLSENYNFSYTTCPIFTRGYQIGGNDPFTSDRSDIIYCTFLRYSSYDVSGYEAYRYIYTYPVSATIQFCDVYLQASGFLEYEAFTFNTDYVFLYYPVVEQARTQGYQQAQDYYTGIYYAPGGTGYNTIYSTGDANGYARGFSAGQNTQINTNWLVGMWQAVDAFFSIRLFNDITFGWLFGVPFAISVVWFIIRQFRGGGGD